MNNLNKKGQIIAILLLVSTLAWLFTMVWCMGTMGGVSEKIDYVQWVMKFKISFIICYLNATVLTVLCLALFWILFQVFAKLKRGVSEIALFFLLIYGTINLVVYISQFVVLPLLAHNIFETDLSSDDIDLIYNWIQIAPGTKMANANAMAYAILGIPSIIFGLLIVKHARTGKAGGWLLMANAVFCIAGVVGIYINNNILQLGTLIGGVVFMVAIFFIWQMFRK
jgi:hypothetical protein